MLYSPAGASRFRPVGEGAGEAEAFEAKNDISDSDPLEPTLAITDTDVGTLNASLPTRPSADRPPLVSICVPTYNGAQFLSQCLETALAQSWGDFEVVVVDDCSTDTTLEIAAAFATRDRRVKVYQNDRNLGMAGNWNQCVRSSRGEWIKFLFQDDLLEPSCISRMLEIRRPGVLLIVVRRALDIEPDTPQHVKEWYQWHAAEGMLRSLSPMISFVGPRNFAARVVERPTLNCIGEPMATLIHRSAFDRFGSFNPDFKLLTDWESFARIGVHCGLCYIDEELATFRVHSKSTTQTELDSLRFRAADLDFLIMFHELAYSPIFEPVRVEAMRRRHPIVFPHRLVRESRRARRKAKRYARNQGGGQALVEFTALTARYPRLLETPHGYFTASVFESLRRVRWGLMRWVADLGLTFRRAIRPLTGRWS